MSTLSPTTSYNLHRVSLQEFIRSQHGKFVTVDYTKKNGMSRTLNGRLGVHHKGGANTVEALDRPYLTMYDMKVHGFRTVNLSNVRAIRACKHEYVITSAEFPDTSLAPIVRGEASKEGANPAVA